MGWNDLLLRTRWMARQCAIVGNDQGMLHRMENAVVNLFAEDVGHLDGINRRELIFVLTLPAIRRENVIRREHFLCGLKSRIHILHFAILRKSYDCFILEPIGHLPEFLFERILFVARVEVCVFVFAFAFLSLFSL